MRIVTTTPFLTETVAKFGLRDSIVGVSWECDAPPEVRNIPKVTSPQVSPQPGVPAGAGGILGNVLEECHLSLEALAALQPDCLLLSSRLLRDAPAEIDNVRERLESYLKGSIRLGNFHPLSLDEAFADFARLGRLLQRSDAGISLTQRLKSQMLDWCSNFNSRMRNRRAVVIGSLAPLSFLGRWTTDLVRLCSGATLVPHSTDLLHELTAPQLRDFRPDILIVAVPGRAPMDALGELRRTPYWEDLPAVKRGEVNFVRDPEIFHRPGPRLLDACAVLVASMAAIDPGYIGERDSYKTLRWLELHGRVR